MARAEPDPLPRRRHRRVRPERGGPGPRRHEVQARLRQGLRAQSAIPVRGRELAGKSRQHLSFALTCFWREGDDFSAVNVPFTLEGTGSGELQISKLRINKRGKATTACPDYRTQSVTPERLQESGRGLVAAAPRGQAGRDPCPPRSRPARGPRLPRRLITQGWEGDGKAAWAAHFAKHNAVALGFGGDRTENLLWRLQHGEIDGMAPRPSS